MATVPAHTKCDSCSGAITKERIQLHVPEWLANGFSTHDYDFCSLSCLAERATYWSKLEKAGRL